MILDTDTRSRLDRLAVVSGGRVRGIWTGTNRSSRLGESMDFADYREYTPGDDFRRIDYNLWARLGVVLIKLFEAEDEMPLRIVLDASGSMKFGRKWRTAQELAGMVAYLGLTGGDRVRLMSTGKTGRTTQGPWLRHRSSWPQFEAAIEAIQPEGEGGLVEAARTAAASTSLRGPFVVVSDLLEPGWETAIKMLGSRGGGIILHTLAPSELDPDLTGDLTLRDAENSAERNVSLSAKALARYVAKVEDFRKQVENVAASVRFSYAFVRADAAALRTGLDHLVRAGAVR
ncbi:MAG: DUF58 domain-containing protein [Acidobacteria bacterium]|nr:DUF58 domain-containing protein [Acidobacteriota bacterium]